MAKTRNRKKPVLSLIERISNYAEVVRATLKVEKDPEQIELIEKRLNAADRARWIVSTFRGTGEAFANRKPKSQIQPKPVDPDVEIS